MFFWSIRTLEMIFLQRIPLKKGIFQVFPTWITREKSHYESGLFFDWVVKGIILASYIIRIPVNQPVEWNVTICFDHCSSDHPSIWRHVDNNWHCWGVTTAHKINQTNYTSWDKQVFFLLCNILKTSRNTLVGFSRPTTSHFTPWRPMIRVEWKCLKVTWTS